MSSSPISKDLSFFNYLFNLPQKIIHLGLSDRDFTLYFKNAVLFLYLFFIGYIMITIKKQGG
ncbi:hypothetical protein CKG09_04615 [Lactobacillus helveticus]|nr:hypothetical protein CKG09_04615 [Lactobacillus helveticus]